MNNKSDLMLTVNQIIELNNKIKDYQSEIDRMLRYVYVYNCSKYGINFDDSSSSHYVSLEEGDISCLINLRKQKIKNLEEKLEKLVKYDEELK